jgi:hypothetical protein
MATVETFGVKPTGFLASWRYVNVDVSDNGIVTNSDVPGKPSVNLDEVTDYRTNNRAYVNGQMITSFCNLTTFTRYNVFAQNARPFAYVTTDLNDPTCGYETPLPEPAVPYNPFGNPVYGAYRTLDYCDRYGVQIEAIIEKKAYVGASSAIPIGGRTPVVRSYKQVQQKTDPIRPQEVNLSFVNTEDFLLSEFYNEDERTFRVTIIEGGLITFRGYIIPDSCSEPFDKAPYEVSIRCTDALGSLETVTYPFPVGPSFNLRQTFLEIIAYCLAPLNLNLDIVTICNLYEKTMPTGLSDDPLNLVTINPLRLANDAGKILTSYEVLKQVCTAWGMFIVQDQGRWCVVRSNELSSLVVRKRTYNYKGLLLMAENIYNERIVGSVVTSQDLVPRSGGFIDIQNAYKRVEVLSNFGKVPSILYNGDFEAWNGFNWTFWTKYGGIDVSRVQRTIVNSVGAVTPIENYALRFNKRANPGKYLEHTPIPVQFGDTIKYSYRVGKTPTGTPARPSRIVYFKMRVKAGDFYLYNADAGNAYEWVKSLAIVTNRIENPEGDLSTFTFGFQIPECPVTGPMVIQLFGFTDTLTEGIIPDTAPITQIQIDDIAATKTSQSGENDISGMLNITDNVKYFTQRPPRIEILFGDYFYRRLAVQELDNLYAMYVGTEFTTGWVEYGKDPAPVAFGLALAKSIMRAYQQPFAFWTGALEMVEGSKRFSYLDVIGFNVPGRPDFSAKRFSFLGVDIDIKNNELYNVKMAEVFDRSSVTVDNTVPYYPNMPEAVFVQDSNYVKPTGIFSDEFTDEFN